MVPSLEVARRRGGSARVDSHLGGAAQFAVRPRLVAGYIAGLGSADQGQFVSGDRARPAAKNSYDHRPASAHILTPRATMGTPHRRPSASRISTPDTPRPFHAFGVDRHRTMNVCVETSPKFVWKPLRSFHTYGLQSARRGEPCSLKPLQQRAAPVSATPSAARKRSLGPCDPNTLKSLLFFSVIPLFENIFDVSTLRRHLEALATNIGETCALTGGRKAVIIPSISPFSKKVR